MDGVPPSRNFRQPRSIYDKEVQGVIWQVVTLGRGRSASGWYLYSNMIHNLAAQQIQTGWDFLWRAVQLRHWREPDRVLIGLTLLEGAARRA